MILIYGLTLIFLGLLAVPSLILSKKPDAKALFDKVAPYQGWIGVIFCLWGIWGIIDSLLNISPLLSLVPFLWIIWFVGTVLMALLGFILGFGLIKKHALSKNPAADAKGEAFLKKLLPLQGMLGILAIVVGIIQILIYIRYS